MKHYDPEVRIFASCLAAVAGYADAVGFLRTGGYFVSFMSGNSTRMAVGVAERSGEAMLGLMLISAFVAGVAVGAAAGRLARRRRAMAVLGLVAALLACAALLLAFGDAPSGVLVLAFAMGAENTVFEKDGEVGIGLTYMTGSLVRLGEAITSALSRGDLLGWAPHFALWLGMVLGAILGASIFDRFGVAALWGAAAAMAILALVSPAVPLRRAVSSPD